LARKRVVRFDREISIFLSLVEEGGRFLLRRAKLISWDVGKKLQMCLGLGPRNPECGFHKVFLERAVRLERVVMLVTPASMLLVASLE